MEGHAIHGLQASSVFVVHKEEFMYTTQYQKIFVFSLSLCKLLSQEVAVLIAKWSLIVHS